MNKTIVVIPAYQEEASIADIVQSIRHQNFEVLVINDCSSDRTAENAKKAGARVISLPVNRGYGTALQTGYKYAWKNGYRYLIQLDGDGQHDPAQIPQLINPVSQGICDLAIGSRFLSEKSYSVPFLRRTGMFVFAKILSLLTGKRFTDPTSGYQAMNYKILQIFVTDAFPRDYPDADMLLMIHRTGLVIKEFPVIMHGNITGKSMHAGVLKPIYYVFRMLLGLGVTLLRKTPNIQVISENDEVDGE